MQLKIISWNIWFDGFFDKVASFLQDAEADIIGLQEVVSDDKSRDVINFLKARGYQHVFAPVSKLKKDGRTFGNAIFSKRRILSNKTHILSESESRNAVQAEIEVGNSTLHVFSTHLLHTHQQPSEIQALQSENLLRVLPPEKTIVLGDFNATPESVVIQNMENVLNNPDHERKPTWSVYPEGCPVCRPQKINILLDYIFTSRDVKIDTFRIGDSKGSDHLPISAQIKI